MAAKIKVNQITMATARILGRSTASAGSAEEISLGGTLNLSGGSLAVASVPTAVTFAATGGAAAGSTFNGATARTVDYSTVGAAPLASPTFTGKVTTAASAAGSAGLNLPHGAAPSSPANGDMWSTTAGVFHRINGATKQVAFTDSNITGSAGSVANLLTFNNGGAGAASGSTFNGSAAVTISYNSIGAAPTASPTFTGTVVAPNINSATGVNLQYNGATKVTTDSTGIIVTGVVSASGNLTTAGAVLITGASTTPSGPSNGQGQMWGNASSGLCFRGAGSTTSMSFISGSGATIFSIDNSGMTVNGTLTMPSAPIITAASSASQTGLRLPHGQAPTSPVDGDVWTTAGGMFARISGGTVGPFGAGGGGTTTNPLTFSSGGAGAAPSSTFDGSVARTISYNSIGAGGLSAANSWTNTQSYSQKVSINSGGTTYASMNLGQGSAPSSPGNGDVWMTTNGLYCYANGVTLGPLGRTTNNLTFASSGGVGSGSQFNGASAITVDYSTVGAAPTASPTFTGTVNAAAITATGNISTALAFKITAGSSFPTLPTSGQGWMYGDTTEGLVLCGNGSSRSVSLCDSTGTTRINVTTSGCTLSAPTVTGTLTAATINYSSGIALQYNGSTKLTIGNASVSLTGATLFTIASSSTRAGLYLPHGSAPSTPNDGDIWTTTAGLYVRINGATVGPLTAGGGGAVSDSVYSVSWDGSTATAPSQNAVYDKIETLAPKASPTFTGDVNVNGNLSMTGGYISTAAPTAGGAYFNLAHGTAPSSPTNGDVWTTSSGLFVRLGGQTREMARVDNPTFTGTMTQQFINHSTGVVLQYNTATKLQTDNLGVMVTGRLFFNSGGQLHVAQSLSGGCSLNIAPGTAPSAPANGDVWVLSTGIYVRINGVTIGPLVDRASLRPAINSRSASFTAADSDNNSHMPLSGAGQTITLNSTPAAGTSFTCRCTTAWSISCTSLCKNGAAAVANGSIAAGSLVTFLHESAGTWNVSGNGIS